MEANKQDKFTQDLKHLFKQAGAKTSTEQLKLLQGAIPHAVNNFMRPWSNTIDIDCVQKAEVGVAMLMTYIENGQRYVLLCQSGEHYFRDCDDEKMPERYTYPGGFANLERREGSFFVSAEQTAEEPEHAGAREVEEEIVDDKGQPIVFIDPKRCEPLDHVIVENKYQKPIVVCSMFYRLAPNEVEALKNHLAKLKHDEEYRAECSARTQNPASRLAEIYTAKFVTVHEAATQISFLHAGQEEHVRTLVRRENDTSSKLIPTKLN